jgi:tetratricopeptide (TPR) repeat protein
MELEDYTRALQSFRRAFALQPAQSTGDSYLKEAFGRALVLSGQLQAARAVFDSVRTGNTDQRARGERSLGLLEMLGGRYDQAIAHFREATILSDQPGKALSQARNRLFLAAAEQEKGRLDSARTQLRETYRLFRSNYFEPTFLMFLGKALVRAGELRLAGEVLDTLRRRVRPSNPIDMANLRVLSGEVLLSAARDGSKDSALVLLQQAYVVDSSRLVAESIAHALASKGDLIDAAGRYEAMSRAASQWYGWEAEPYGLTALLEAGRLYEKAGDTSRARGMYERHVAQRAGGDSDIASVREARAALARIESMSSRARK